LKQTDRGKKEVGGWNGDPQRENDKERECDKTREKTWRGVQEKGSASLACL